MRNVVVSCIASACVIGAAIVPLRAENWPQWRGPRLNGVSADRGLPVKWSKTDGLAWTLPMPEFSARPWWCGETIFLNTADGDKLQLWAVDRAKGAVAWKGELGGGNFKIRKQNMSSPSPVTDGRNVWVMTGTGVVKAFDFGGRELWARDIQKDYGTFGLNWGYGSSPLLHGDALYIQVLHGMKTDDPSHCPETRYGHGQDAVAAERPTPAEQEPPDAYTTPALLRYGSSTEVVVSAVTWSPATTRRPARNCGGQAV